MITLPINADDITVARSPMYETIPITGSLLSGTYGTYPNDINVITYSHGLFESVHDYPWLSSSANHIFDLTFGVRSGSSTPVTQSSEKFRIYKQMAQTLMGFDVTGNVRNFTLDGSTISSKLLFINFSRLLTKDGIKIGSFSASFGTASYTSPFSSKQTFTDNSGITEETVPNDSPVGQYWYLYTGSTYSVSDRVGIIFYQQGVVALDVTKNLFDNVAYSSSVSNPAGGYLSGSSLHSTGTIVQVCDGFRRHVNNLQFLNTVQIYSTIYFCRVSTNHANYSTNPTYTSASQIVVKNSVLDVPVTFITTVGLYDGMNNLLAVAKLSEPIKKTPEDSLIFRVRLDY